MIPQPIRTTFALAATASVATLALSHVALSAIPIAYADNTNSASTFGAPVSFGASAGGTYAGIATQVVGTSGGGTLSYAGTTAWIMGGVNSSGSSAVVSMSWRTALVSERYGTSTVPPMPDSPGYNSLSSDVLQLTGITSTGSVDAEGRLPTDAYALQMTFDPNNMVRSYQWGATTGWDLQDIINVQEAVISYFSPVTNMWSKNLNYITPGASRVENFWGDYTAFATAQGLTDTSDLTAYVGSFGVYATQTTGAWGTYAPGTYVMWGIFDHTSTFGAVPAPGALGLLGMAGLVGTTRRRRA